MSKKYLHDLKKLITEHDEQHITDEEFSQRIDELREWGAQSNESLGRLLLLQKLAEMEIEIENEVKKEAQRKKQALAVQDQVQQMEHTRQLQRQLLEQQNKENERNSYRSEIDSYINHLENNAQKWQKWYTWLQIILLVFSAGTATMASIEGVPRWVVSFAGLIATIAGGLLTTFKIQDRIYANRKAIAEVKLESQKYDYHIEEYSDMDAEAAFIKFTRVLSTIQGQEMLQEVELWNPKKDDKSARDSEAQRSLTGKAESKEKPDEQQSANSPQNEGQEQAKIEASKGQLQPGR